jgi:hypothetical protein
VGQFTVLVIGLDNAGKTTLTFTIKGGACAREIRLSALGVSCRYQLSRRQRQPLCASRGASPPMAMPSTQRSRA